MTIRRVGRVLRAVLGLLLLPLIPIFAFAFLVPDQTGQDLAQTDVIVVLGAGMSNGTLHPNTLDRVKAGVVLWQDGLAPRLHMTGGTSEAGPTTGALMEDLAAQLGVPRSALSHEGKSFSTLQNALFTQPMVPQEASLRLVTDGFHLPRAWASFRVMGPQRLYLSPANRISPKGAGAAYAVRVIARECLAWWFNTARFTAWWIAGGLGLSSQETRDAWLA